MNLPSNTLTINQPSFNPAKYLRKGLLTNVNLTIFLFLLGNIAYGQVQFEWAKSVGSSFVEEGNSITVDELGNIYTTGTFRGTIDFDPNSGVSNLTAVGLDDIFIQKLDPNGNLIWAKNMGGTSYEQGNAIAVDTIGNIYITGTFQGTVDFDPNTGVRNLTSTGGSFNVFIQKLDSNGNLIWAKSMGGGYNDEGNSITVDNLGNVYTTGHFHSTADFDPNVGVSNLSALGSVFNVFIQKLDSNGNLLWAKSVAGHNYAEGTSIAVDDFGSVYTTGYFFSSADFDPGVGVSNLGSTGLDDIFIQKLDSNGNFLWVKQVGGSYSEHAHGLALDGSNNIYVTGGYEYIVDFDPNAGVSNLTSMGYEDIFIQKLDMHGNFLWAKSMGSIYPEQGNAITVDQSNNVYTTGWFRETIDFDPNAGISNLTTSGGLDIFIQKLDPNGNLLWAKQIGGINDEQGNAIAIDALGSVHTIGIFEGTVDFNPNVGVKNLVSIGFKDVFIQKMLQEKVVGKVYHDFNQNCALDSNEIGLSNRLLIINPGNIVTTTNSNGIWSVDSLPVGNYTITVDTSGNWLATCPVIQNFTIVNPNSFVTLPPFGLVSTAPCAEPDISIHAPFLRPGFSNQRVYIQACNQAIGTGALDSAYVVIELDSLLSVQSSSLPYIDLGNHQYRVHVDTLIPGICVNFWMDCTLSMNAILGQSLCMKAVLYPVDSCSLDSIPNSAPTGINPCNTAYDGSHLSIQSICNNDSIHFIIRNIGDGDMSCYSQVRLYIDGQYIWMDSIQLISSDTTIFTFAGDGRTWRLEVDQHPLHLGSSHPSTTIELCGNESNWTSDLVNILPQDDADPNVAIFCGLVTGSYAPNDKTGYPLGINNSHDILPNQDLEYVIRFQNTGTDTAFTVVIRDTLSPDLDVFSVQPGASNHNYTFRIYGPRVLEWTFNNIMLPDSTTNEPNSNGFVTFKVNQTANLPIGTVIENNAAIYFDFNPPIITNTTTHRIALSQDLNWDGQDTLNLSACDSYTYNNITYNNSGTYWQARNAGGLDSLYTLNLTILNSIFTTSERACSTYTAPDSQVYTTSGQYIATLTNVAGCDSTVIINLTIGNTSTYSTINEITNCSTYLAPDGNVYTTSRQYTATIPNTLGCDSIISINLTILAVPIDTTVTYIGSSLFCFASNASFQWLDCGNAFAPVAGATSGIFSPTGNGSYAVEVSQNGCIDTSSCHSVVITGLPSPKNNVEWLIYPNPVTDVLFISNKGNNSNTFFIELINPLGQILISKMANTSTTEVNLKNLPSGIYNLSIKNDTQTVIQKIIKQ